MASLNKVQLIGNLGKDPELKYTPNGTAVCSFSIATTRTYTDKDGNKQDKTEWHNIKVWQKQAEIAAEYLRKGKQVYIEGRLETRSWEQDGQKKYATDIIAERFLMLGTKPSGEGESGQKSSSSRPQQSSQSQPPKKTSEDQPPPFDDGPPDEMSKDEDLPF